MRLIDADAFAEDVDQIPEGGYLSPHDLISLINARPTIEERKKGKWIDDMPWIEQNHSLRKGLTYRCSECGHRTGTYKHKTYNYCPNCGAKMDMREA